ncbi:MAG TPA: cation:proton antiporter [Nitriliruptorales bacterium]
MLAPLTDHELLVFWVQLATLLAVARGLGYLARRVRQPAVVGELLAGVLLGPTVLGRVAPDVAAWLFPGDRVQSGLLLALAWLGVVVLLVLTGLEVDLPLVGRLVRRTAWIPVGGLILPLLGGYAVGRLVPDLVVPEGVDRAVFAAFIAVALAVSALPVVARVLTDMGLIRRDIGQVTMVAAMADDLVGWILLGLLTGVAVEGGFDAAGLGVTILAVGVFLVGAFTVGQRAVDATLRAALRLTEGVAGAFTAIILMALTGAALTQWIGTEAVLGAFIVGILIGRSPLRRRELEHGLELWSSAVLAPLFFATAGMYLDAGVLTEPAVAIWSGVLLLVACVTKLGGAYLGARLGRFDPATGLAVGIGLNARGALGVIAATVGLATGVFGQVAYTAIVLMSIVTSMLVPPLMTWALRRVPLGDEEAERLRREALYGGSVLINARRVLLATRGGVGARVAARVIDLVMHSDASVTVMSVDDGSAEPVEAVTAVTELFGHRRVTASPQPVGDPASAVLHEVGQGYDLLAVGATGDTVGTSDLSPVLQRLLVESPVPVLLVRPREPLTAGVMFQRLLTAATGTPVGQAAEEISYLLAARVGAEVDVVHVVSRADQVLAGSWGDSVQHHPVARAMLHGSVELARRFGMAASGLTRIGATAYEELLAAAHERGADTLVIGARVRSVDGRPFLGHGIEYLLQHAPQSLIIVAVPPNAAEPAPV